MALAALDEALTEAEIRRQWRDLLAREAAPTGKRQVAFTPLETVLAAMASYVVRHNRYGGGTSHLAPSPVPELAALFHRPPSSVLAKMANVDGSRPNGARMDVAVGTEILASPQRVAAAYTTIFAVARSLGVGPFRLPDFLGIERLHDFALMGQEEIEADLDEAVQERVHGWGQVAMQERETRKLAETWLRVGQHKFAADVLRNYHQACAFCGLRPPVRRAGFLRASHIKPWRVSSNRERLDPANGLAACPTHDVAFDTGMLTVNGGLRIHVAPSVAEQVSRSEPLAHVFGRPPLRERILLPADAVPPHVSYLRWHHDHVWVA